MSRFGRSGAVVVLVVAALFAVGCGGTVIDDTKTEEAIDQSLERSQGQKVSSVDCPSGVEIEKGDTFDCDVEFANGERKTVTLKILNSDADLEEIGLKPR